MMLQNAVIVCIASIDWRDNWQAPQEIASAFASGGHRVLFVENTGVRRPALKDLRRLRRRLQNWRRVPRSIARQGVELYSPVIVPLPYSRVACRINAAAMLRIIRRWIGPQRSEPLVVITYLPTPLVRAIVDQLEPDLVVYYALDYLSASSPGAGRLRPHEEALLRDADMVFTTSNGLHEVALKQGARVEMLSHGVRAHEFERARRAGGEPPAPLRHLKGPIVGFAGSVREELELDLLARIAARVPDLNFVFIGPIIADVAALRALSNVHFIAPVPHEEVVQYVAHFDAGILPYVQNSYTACILPAKLKEYLAAGLPVVATRLPEVCRFAEAHPGVIAFADDADAFVRELRAALTATGDGLSEQRMAVARVFDWSIQFDRMCQTMETILRERTHS